MLRLCFLPKWSLQLILFGCYCLLISSVFILSQANLIERDNKIDVFWQGDVGQLIKQRNLSQGANEIPDELTSAVLSEKLKQKLARKDDSVGNQQEQATDKRAIEESMKLSIKPNEPESQLQVYPLPTKPHSKQQASNIQSLNILYSNDNKLTREIKTTAGVGLGYNEDNNEKQGEEDEEKETKEKQLLKQTKVSSFLRKHQQQQQKQKPPREEEAETGRDIQNSKEVTNDHNEEADASNDSDIKGGSEIKNSNTDDNNEEEDDDENDGDEDDDDDDNEEDARLDSENEFSGLGVANSSYDKKQLEIIGQKNVNKGGQESDRAKQLLDANSSNSNTLEPLEYDISLDDSEEAWLDEDEPENKETNGKIGTNNGITKEATSTNKSPLVKQVKGGGVVDEGEGQEEEEEDYEEGATKEGEEDDEDESEEQENDNNNKDDDNEDDEQVQDEAGLDDNGVEDESEEEGRENEEGRFRHLPVLAQNLSGFWLAGSGLGGRELKLHAANSMVRQEDRIKQRQRQRLRLRLRQRRRRRKGKQEGSRFSLKAKEKEKKRGEKNDENENKLKIDSNSFSDEVKHKKKIKGVSKHLMYLEESQPEVYSSSSKLEEVKEEQKANIKPHNFQNGALIPLLETQYIGKVRENERLVELTPKLRILNQVEVCDIELFVLSPTKDNDNDANANANADHHNHHIDYNVKNKKYSMNKERQHNSNIKPSKLPLLSSSSANIIKEDKQQQQQEEQIRKLPFIVSWIDRINGEATLEAKSEKLMNCERERNYTFKMRAIGCNGLHSNDALVSVTLEDVNEFSPEFERQLYSLTLDLDPKHVKLHDLLEKENGPKQHSEEDRENGEEILLQVQARDQDCSTEFGSICRYELLADPHHWTSQQQQQQQQLQQQTNLESLYNQDLMSALSVDSSGRVKIKRHFLEKAASTGSFLGNSWNWHANLDQQQQQQTKDDSTSKTSSPPPSSSSSFLFSFQVIAYDCGDKKSLAPATIHLHLNKLCRPKLKDVDTLIAYKPQSGDRLPFLRAQFDLCGTKCHRPNISLTLKLEATPKFDHKTEEERRSLKQRKMRPSFVTFGNKNVETGKESNNASTKREADRHDEDTFRSEPSGGSFHCDRESYSMVSKRRLCGARNRRAIELLPPYNVHNKWILTLHRQLTPLRAASISELNKDLRQQQQQQLDSSNEPIGLDRKNLSYNNIDGYNDKDYENELNGELDNNLNAYSPRGAYGRQAFEFFTSKAAANNLQIVSNGAEISPEALKFEAGNKLNHRFKQQWKRQRRLNVRSASGKLNNSHLRVSTNAFSSEYDHQGDNSNEPKSSSLLDWSSIYRDQVYRFDGSSKAVVIPKAIYSSTSSSSSSSSSYQQSFILNDQAKNKINVNENTVENETPPDISNSKQHREQFIFGSRHTISFWMRHAPFKFPPSTSEMLFLGSTNTNNHFLNSEKIHQSSASVNMSKDELDELAKHVKEHIICGSLDSFETQTKHSNSSSATATSTPPKQKPHNDYHHQHRPNYKHHHYYYALFVRNCKLVLMMRRHLNESHLNDAKNYQPTEWRWSFDTTSQSHSGGIKSSSKNIICDNKWHLYTINVNYPIAELYIDGQQFEENYNNLVIVDDLPLPQVNVNNRHLNDSSLDSNNRHNNMKSETEISENIVLSVGACLDSRHQTWSGHFKGSLSGLSVLMNENDDSNTIECLGKCSEALVSTANNLPMQDQQEGSSTSKFKLSESLASSSSNMGGKLDNSLISYQESQSKISLNGHDFIDVEDALSQIAYKNNRLLPSIGKRSIIIESNIECHHHHQSQLQPQPQQQSQQITANHQEQLSQAQHGTFIIPIEPVKVEVSVLPSKNLPVISINGITNMAREYSPFMDGINLFSSINIHIKQIDLQSAQDLSKFTSLKLGKNLELHINKSQSTKKSAQDHDVTTSQYADYIEDSNLFNHQPQQQQQQVIEPIEPSLIKRRIEACSINVDPPLNGSYESLVLPIDKMNGLNLYWRQSQYGAVIYGVDSVENYQSILRSVVYKNLEPAYYLERIFKLICSDMNGRLVSNEYSQTLSIIHLNKRTIREEISDTQNEMSPTKFSNLRMSNLHTLSEQTPVVDEPLKLNVKHHYDYQHQQGQQQQSLNMLNLEQTTKLDRIAIAFLVFVVSLIVIMIIIALTNLKEPSLKNSSFENSYGSNTNKQLIYGSNQALSYDIDSTQNGCYYGDELMIDDLDDSGDEDADEEDDDYIEEEREEEEGEQQVGNVRENKTRKEAERGINNEKLSSRYSNSDFDFNQQTNSFKSGQIKLRKFHTQTSMESSSTNTGLESLAWDDEVLNDDYTIVMNPIIHGIKIKNNRSNQAQEREIMRTSVTEQRPNKSGSMTQKPQTHLSYHSPILAGACSSQFNHHQDYELEFDEDAASTSSEMGDFRTLSPTNQYHSSPSNSRSNSTDSGSSSSSCSSDEDIHINTCKHRHNDVEDDDNELSISSGQYEIYHAHQHHFHHTCLKQLDCPNTSSQDSDELSTDTAESADEFNEETGERHEENVVRLQDHHESYNSARSSQQYVRRRFRNNSEAQNGMASEMATTNVCQSQNRPTFQSNSDLIIQSDGDNDHVSTFDDENATSISWISSRDDENSRNSIPSLTAALTIGSLSSNSEKSIASLTSPSRNDLN